MTSLVTAVLAAAVSLYTAGRGWAHEAELVQIRAELNKAQTQFVSLHEERAARIQDLWEQLVSIEDNLQTLLDARRAAETLPPRSRPDSLALAIREFAQDSRKSQIYFDDQLVKALQSASGTLTSRWLAVDAVLRRSGWDDGQRDEGDWANPWEHDPETAEQLQAALLGNLADADRMLVAEFRAILGV